MLSPKYNAKISRVVSFSHVLWHSPISIHNHFQVTAECVLSLAGRKRVTQGTHFHRSHHPGQTKGFATNQNYFISLGKVLTSFLFLVFSPPLLSSQKLKEGIERHTI